LHKSKSRHRIPDPGDGFLLSGHEMGRHGQRQAAGTGSGQHVASRHRDTVLAI